MSCVHFWILRLVSIHIASLRVFLLDNQALGKVILSMCEGTNIALQSIYELLQILGSRMMTLPHKCFIKEIEMVDFFWNLPGLGFLQLPLVYLTLPWSVSLAARRENLLLLLLLCSGKRCEASSAWMLGLLKENKMKYLSTHCRT